MRFESHKERPRKASALVLAQSAFPLFVSRKWDLVERMGFCLLRFAAMPTLCRPYNPASRPCRESSCQEGDRSWEGQLVTVFFGSWFLGGETQLTVCLLPFRSP